MDQPSLPTAAELGISEGEYERILRDMRRPREEGPRGARRPGDRRSGWLPLAVLAVVAAVVAVLLAPPEREPTYAFLYTVAGQPVTYSSCGTIEVAVYPAGGPPDAEALVDEAVAQMRVATGLDIVVVGSFVGQAPNWDSEAGTVHHDDSISVSWQDGQTIEELTDHTAGLGGSRIVAGPDGTQRLVAGTIALSRDYYTSLSEQGEKDEALAVLLHEFGHVFGLDHVDSPSELMNAGNTRRSSWGVGDLQGLRLLGRGPCL